jgi:hypothetical protein
MLCITFGVTYVYKTVLRITSPTTVFITVPRDFRVIVIKFLTEVAGEFLFTWEGT